MLAHNIESEDMDKVSINIVCILHVLQGNNFKVHINSKKWLLKIVVILCISCDVYSNGSIDREQICVNSPRQSRNKNSWILRVLENHECNSQ